MQVLTAHVITYLGGVPRRDQIVPILLSGVVAAVISIIFSLSFAGLIFNGMLSNELPRGIGMAIVGTLVLTITMPLVCSYHGTVGGLIAEPAIVLGIVAASLARDLQGDQLLYSVIAAVMVAGLVTGIGLWIVASFRLGQIGQYVPYPVIGGFLAGLGILLCKGSAAFVLPFELSVDSAGRIEGDLLVQVMLVGAVGLAIWAIQKVRPSPYNIPVMLFVTVAGFWLLCLGMNKTAADLAQAGWLLGAFPETGIWSPNLIGSVLQGADWQRIALELPKLGIVPLLILVSALMDASSLELVVRRDIDPNRELRAVGIANFLSGIVGGFLGTTSLSATKLNATMGMHFRYVGLVATLVVGAIILFGLDLISLTPRFAVAGILFYIGIEFVVEWLIGTRNRVSTSDYMIVVIVFLVVVVFGLVEGFLAGVVLGFLLFSLTYSRLPIVKFATDGTARFSNVDRFEEDHAFLRDSGGSLYILKLQGFIFFGTARKLVEQVRARMQAAHQQPLSELVLDFELVNGLDSSAMANFLKVRQYAENSGFRITVSHASEDVLNLWRKYEILVPGDQTVISAATMDLALEAIEESRLHGRAQGPDTIEPADAFEIMFKDKASYEEFLGYCDTATFSEGEYLCRQGDPSNEMYLIRKGQVSVYLETDTASVRIRKCLPGFIVGQMAMYLGSPRTASVIADETVVAYTLTRAAIERMRLESPDTLIEFQNAVIRGTAQNLQDTDRLMNEMGI